MYKFEEICELIKIVGSSGLAGVEIEHAGGRVRIEGRPVAEAVAPMVVQQPTVAPPTVTPAEQAVAAEEDEDLHMVVSPIVGTFYRSPSPEADPYVKVGDFVEKGQVLCIVEAMKLMNEIECEATGTITKIYRDNAEPVEYGQPLFSLRAL